MTNLGWRIRRLRRDRGWTQVELAAEVGVQRFTVGRWEAGIDVPKLAQASRLADAFRCSIDWLAGRVL